MGDDSTDLSDLIGAVADGGDVDWDALAQATTDEKLRAALAQLRTIDGVARIHRSQLADEPAAAGSLSAAAPLPAAAPLGLPAAVPAQWGRFLLLRKIGEGNFGEVYHARDGLLDHDVALKLLRPHFDNQRLLHEARQLMKVRHPNVVLVYSADIHDGRVGFWMELVDGLTLGEVVANEGVRSASEAAVIGQDLCRALAAVHALKIAHRDIKARNVMRQRGGRIVLMDFGAGEVIERTRSLRPHTVAGTPLYLAPELLEGAPADERSDIYALGVLLYYLVTGSYPVQGVEFDDLIRAHASGARRHLGDVRPDLPDAFVTTVETMLQPDAAKRYESAGRARAALESVVAAAPIVVGEGTLPAPPWGVALQRLARWLAWIAATCAALTFAGLVSTAAFNQTFGRIGFADETPVDWFVWGVRSLLAPAIFLALGAIGLIVIIAIVRVSCRLVPGATAGSRWLGAFCRDFARQRELDDPNLLLQVVTGAGALTVAILISPWLFWNQLTAWANYIDIAPPELLAALDPRRAAEGSNFWYARSLDLFLFMYGLAVYGVYHVARHTQRRVQRAVATCAVALPVMVLLTMRELPYRIVYQSEFERVDMAAERCYQIGERAGEVLLHCPDATPPRNRVVSATDPRLRPRGVIESVFTAREQSAAVE